VTGEPVMARAEGIARAPADPAELAAQRSVYPARISHTTTHDQREALEEVSRQARRATGQAVPLTALIRAAVQICLDDPGLRERMAQIARTEWR
jgi:hypothetical protein